MPDAWRWEISSAIANGAPVGTVEDAEVSSQLGYLLPVSLIPAEWKRRMGI